MIKRTQYVFSQIDVFIGININFFQNVREITIKEKQHLLNMIFNTWLKQSWCVRVKQYCENFNQNLCESQSPQL